ncbi:class I adenylate-forming enzyme family protein [Streptomyces sp. NPDC060275]|uniref:class I adenylate-forming enzyme family protein n=1 Tax=Streptomyces sp. NPDC060275 TaxID=3347090 RepID=UPI0036562B46
MLDRTSAEGAVVTDAQPEGRTVGPGLGPGSAGRVDGLLAAAAAAHPDRPAVIGETRLTFADLDARASRYAEALRPLIAGRGAPVVVSSAPHPEFMAAYYGAIRAGAVAIPMNPLLPDPAVERIIEQSGAVVALLAPRVFTRVEASRPRLPRLAHVFRLWDDAGEGGVLVAAGPGPTSTARAGGPASVTPVADGSDPAVVMFTSGTTGPSKGVAVSHHAVRTNAAQFGDAHGIDDRSVVMCHLPIVSPMHMNAAVRAGACQLLCPDPDIRSSVRMANAHRATHYYSLPVRLARLASAPELGGLAFDTVRMIAAGNQTIAAHIIKGLSERFGVPVFQGYGLTESTHLAHTDGPVEPRPGSAGPPVAGSRSRIVDTVTGRVRGPGEVGELQINGPQLMTGYVNRPELSPFDDEGWFATGDVARLDEDGYLYVLDRLADVFRHDGLLVSPSRLERALEAHPDVVEVGVADQPDGSRGRTPVAFVVPKDARSDSGPMQCGALLAAVNSSLEAHERIRHAVVTDAVRRSATNGKVDRKALREELARRPAPEVLDEG